MNDKIRFLCGCMHEISDKDVDTDEEAMLVCKEHRERRYGWRSHGRNWRLAHMTPFELESFVVFGVEIDRRTTHVTPPVSPNLRDNRDPEKIGIEILAGRDRIA